MLKQKALPILISFLVLAGCSYFNPEDLNMLIDQSRGSLSLSGLSISPSAITTNAPQEITLSCSVESDFPVNTVTADLTSVGQGKVKLNPSSDKKNWSVKFIVTPSAVGSFSFKITAVNQKEKTAEGSVSFTIMALSLSAVFVSPSGNDANPGSQDFPFQTIQHAVSYATAAGITNIYLSSGSYIEANTAYSCAVALIGLTNLTIQGGWNAGFTARSVETYPTVIDGNHTQPTVMVMKYSSNMTIDGVVLRNGKPDPMLTNFISFRGGGLFAEEANIILINSRIDNNESVYGGGVYASEISGVISNCIISNNEAVDQYSGMVFFRSPVRIEYCSIIGNSGEGAHILNCTNFTFQFNYIFTNTSDGIIISNSVSASPVYSNTFVYNGLYGIKLYPSDITAIVSNRILYNNMGLYIYSNITTSVMDNLLSNNYSGFSVYYSTCKIANNVVIGGGSGLYLDNSIGMVISNNIFSGISAYHAAPVYVIRSSNIVFRENTVQYGYVGGYGMNNYMCSGGMMVLYSTNTAIFNNTIVSNGTSHEGNYTAGGLGLYYSYAYISNNTISWNSGKNGGGILSYNSSFVIFGNRINNNASVGYTSYGSGGVYICNGSGVKIIQNNSISSNVLTGFFSGTPCVGGSGINVTTAVDILSNTLIADAIEGYYADDSVVFISEWAYNSRIITNTIGAVSSAATGIFLNYGFINNMGANVFITNKMSNLFKSYTNSAIKCLITNDAYWTNINNTNYTGSGPISALNTVTNL